MRLSVRVLGLVILLIPWSLSARTWYITPDGMGDAPTIQAGVDSAVVTDSLMLADGIYRGPGNRDVEVRKALLITSESEDPEACVIDCEGSAAEPHRGFWMIGDTGPFRPVLRGITVMNGWANHGGAILMEIAGRWRVQNCRFYRNHAGMDGGAIDISVFVDDYTSFISGCHFEENTAGIVGGAIAVWYMYWHCVIEYCTFIRNYPGAVFIAESDDPPWVEINNCTLLYNSGGASAVYGPADLRRSIIAYGVGEYAVYGPYLYVECCNFYANVTPSGDPAGGQQTDRNCFIACPSFCNAEGGDFRLCDESPCLPGNHPDGYDCGLIGAWGQGCVCGPTQTEPSTWGAIKSMYR